jgi:hypothetical protein
VVRSLFLFRGLRIPRGSLREAVSGSRFAVLDERTGEEIVFGTTGRFWSLRERANMERPADLAAFRAFDRPGWAAAALALRVEPREQGWSKLMTETRIRCLDDGARRRFGLYWALISGPGGWIRRDMLRAIARIAESGE